MAPRWSFLGRLVRPALEYAAADLNGDRDIVRAAVAQDGRALMHATQEIRRDRDIVLAVVAHDGSATEFVAQELKRDRDIGLAAVARDGHVLRHRWRPSALKLTR